MRQIEGFIPYSAWKMDLDCRWTVEIEPLYYDVSDYSCGIKTVERTHRTRVVIEGETAIVNELLGKNFLARQRRVRERHDDEGKR